MRELITIHSSSGLWLKTKKGSWSCLTSNTLSSSRLRAECTPPAPWLSKSVDHLGAKRIMDILNRYDRIPPFSELRYQRLVRRLRLDDAARLSDVSRKLGWLLITSISITRESSRCGSCEAVWQPLYVPAEGGDRFIATIHA